MQTNDLYVQQLENVIINRLLPVYRLYYEQKGEFPPELDLEVIKRMHRQEPALFKRWPLAQNKQGFWRLPRTSESQEKTKQSLSYSQAAGPIQPGQNPFSSS